MELLLKVIDGPSDGSWRGLKARFDASGGLIGRAETARLSLPDSSRTVSRFHAHVSCSGEEFFLEEMGSRNAATINGRALKAGTKELLRPGDEVRIGRFLLAVEFDDPDFPATQVIDRPLQQLEQDEDNQPTRIAFRDGTGSGTPRSKDERLLSAFREGAGVQLDLPAGLRPEFMRTLGEVLRALAAGVRGLTSEREPLQGESTPDKRRARLRRADPIRTAADDARWLSALLTSGEDGTGAPHGQVQEMIDDVAARLSAMRAAANAAVEQTESSLSPAALEERLATSLFLDELLPMRRKARLWDLYRRTHGSASTARPEDAGGRSNGKQDEPSAAASGVRELFNHAFAQAYEAEVSRLRTHRHSNFAFQQASLASSPKPRG
jgi:predicted component of type VI protein secretion system